MHELIEELTPIITFIKEAERLKKMVRTAWSSEGRQESVAEHSWRLALLALSVQKYFPHYDYEKVLGMCLVHDLGEAFEGDVSATIQVDQEAKLRTEQDAVNRLTAPLPVESRTHLLDLWWEYNNVETQEAKLVKALDKMETIIQHNQGANPSDFDYEFNLQYGRKYAEHDPVLQTLREMIDEETRVNMNK